MRITLFALITALLFLDHVPDASGEIVKETFYDSKGNPVTGYVYQARKTWRYSRSRRYGFFFSGGFYGGFYGGFFPSYCAVPHSYAFYSHFAKPVPTVYPSTAPTFRPATVPTVSTIPGAPSVVPAATGSIRPSLTPVVRPTITPTVRPTMTPVVRPNLTPPVHARAPSVRPSSISSPVRPPTARPVSRGVTTLRVYRPPSR